MISFLNHAHLVGLAPTVLVNRRVRRYHGDDLAISLDSFVEPDRTLIRALYVYVQKVFAAVLGDAPERADAVRALADDQTLAALLEQVRQIGVASYEANPSPLLAKTVHDIRGGGLSPLLGRLQLFKGSPHACDTLFFLARDHLKIMRNALLGLDDVKRNADLEIKLHGTDLIVEKWNGTHFSSDHGDLQLSVECPESVEISECCVEFGAIDRILYNMLNNACRHAAGQTLRLVLFPIPNVTGENLRLIFLNHLTAADAAHLRALDLRTLFRAGVSTTGSGYGLNVAATLVANAFGLSTPEEAVDARYLGAELIEDQFVIWFHWPIVAEV